MSYNPVSGIVPQYSTDANELALDYYLKFYKANTTTPLSMAVNSTGLPLLVKCKLNISGMPITNPLDNDSAFIPHVNQAYRLVIYRNATDADNNNTANALVNIPYIAPMLGGDIIGTEDGQLPLAEDVVLKADLEALLGIEDDQVATNAERDSLNAAKPTRKNLFKNGAMAVSQENGDTGITIGIDDYYLADQVFSDRSVGGGGAVAISASSINGHRSVKVTATVAMTDLTGVNWLRAITSNIESQDIVQLGTDVFAISALVETDWDGEIGVVVYNEKEDESISQIFSVESGVNQISVIIPGMTSIPDRTNETGIQIHIGSQNEGGLQTQDNGVWEDGLSISANDATDWAKTTGHFINVTLVQLEKGDKETAFEYKHYSEYLADCLRYFEVFEKNTAGGILPLFTGFYENPTLFKCPMKYHEKVKTPVISLSSAVSISDWAVDVAGSNPSISVITFPDVTNTFVEISITTSTKTAGDVGVFGFGSADSNQKIFIDARL